MTITVDGRQMEVHPGLSVADLLRQEGEPASHVLVEVNRTFVSPGEHQDRVLVEGDDVEIILPAFGG